MLISGELVGRISRRDVARNRDYRGALFRDGGENRGIDDRPRLLRIHEAPGVEGCGFEELVRIEFFERGCVDELRLHIARNGDDRSSLLARVHQPIEQMDDAGAGRSTHRNRVAGQVGLGDGGKNTVLFVADVDELDLAVAAQPVDDGIESVSNNAIAAFDSGVREHLPQEVCNFSRHGMPPF